MFNISLFAANKSCKSASSGSNGDMESVVDDVLEVADMIRCSLFV